MFGLLPFVGLGADGAGVAEALPDVARLGAFFDLVGNKAMAKHMGRHTFLDARQRDILFDDQPQPLAGEPLTALIEEERHFMRVDQQLHTRLDQILAERLADRIVDGCHPAA